jgi:acetyltransferase-like isoleucine patch superfamily enzyme
MKRMAKAVIFGFSILVTFPFSTIYKVSRIFLNSEQLFVTLGQTLSLFPGKIGSYFRVAFYHQALPDFSKNTYVGFGSYFSHPEVEAGEGVYIGAYCIIGKALISRYVTIGSHVNILSGKKQHGFKEIGRPIQEQGGVFEAVRIGKNCWIGNGAIIMASLGKQCIVGAGAVVTSETGDFEVLAGNPAKVIRRLTDSNTKDT